MNKQDYLVYVMHANICKIFTSPIRIMIMDELQKGERTVSQLEQAIEIRQATLSQHLAVLREKGIVMTRRQGQSVHYRISNPKILEACRLMREVLLEQIEGNSRLLGAK